MDFVRGAVPERGIEAWSDRSQCSIHDATSLIAFLLVCYILLVDEFFPARVALNDICFCAVRGTRRFFPPMRGNHTCSWWRCSQRTCTAIPRLDMKNRHTLDGLAVPNRQFCRAFWRQVGSHVSLSWRSQQFFSSSSPVTACRVHESFPGVNIGDVTHQFPELEHQP